MDLMREMGNKGLGCAAVVDEQNTLLGIFTDGDLRRLIEKGVDLRQSTAAQVMHPHPQTVSVDALAVEAAELMELRRITSVPIVYLSSASDNLNIVMAMNMGGDDFIAKPVDPAVLAAKVNAVLRRAYDMPATGNILACGEAVLDLDSAALSIHGQSIPLTRNELIILRTLMEQRGRIVSRETLMTRLWQMDEYVEENTLTVHVNRLRTKLRAAGLPGFIVTKVGSGYAVNQEGSV